MQSANEYMKMLGAALAKGNATEHTHRPALKAFIESLGKWLTATNEPRRIDCGAPDFIITQGPVILGYLEAKDIGKPLDHEEKSDQMRRYLGSLGNLILTDYLEFRWYVQGEKRMTARIGTPGPKGKVTVDEKGLNAVLQLLTEFLESKTATIKSPKELASRMAAIALLIRDTIRRAFESEDGGGTLHGQMKGFQEVLLHDLDAPQFADMYAQTICYGLFAARCAQADKGEFTRVLAPHLLPKTNPFLRKLFNHIAGVDLDDRIVWVVDDLAELLNRADIQAILKDFGRRTRQEDPVVHFYETFLAAYDPKLRESRGVYYTPEPVVSYIVRSVDHLLKTEFGLKAGLADATKVAMPLADGGTKQVHKVQVLDPATGTGTFLHGVIDQIHETFKGNEGMWSSYVSEHLLPRLFGFELLMAPYAVAHLKLGLQLAQSGYDFHSDERLRVYLTNTLEEAFDSFSAPYFTQWLAEEANAAGQVKRDAPVMVVLGNPPYSGLSANMSNSASRMVDAYKIVDGKPLGERKHWLQDDYVKFIRFAQARIEKTGHGVLAFISNHGYLDNPTFRGMRQSLMTSFDEIYLLDLHGNTKKKETSPDGSPDKNVFDIQQGVTIGIFIRRADHEKTCKVSYCDLWGTREFKYQTLEKESLATTKWIALAPQSPQYLFKPQNLTFAVEYERGWSIHKIFPINSSGIVTARDHFVVGFSEKDLLERMHDFADVSYSDDEIRHRYFEGKGSAKYATGDSRGWKLPEARQLFRKERHPSDRVVQVLYRPFDFRSMFYTPYMVDWPRLELMQHMMAGKNFAFGTTRSTETGRGWEHIFCASGLIQHHTVSLKEVNYLFPLYLYPEVQEGQLIQGECRPPNLSADFITDFSTRLKLAFIPDGKGDLKRTFGPEDVFAYAYAIFHAPSYRSRYAEFLKIDFPRLPLTQDVELFRKLCALGDELVGLHLMERTGPQLPGFPFKGRNEVEKVRYAEPESSAPGRVWINADQCFEGVAPEVWDFHVGGYQVAQKWLKDRKGRVLTHDDLNHYRQIIAALAETLRLMAEVDQAIESSGGWPLA